MAQWTNDYLAGRTMRLSTALLMGVWMGAWGIPAPWSTLGLIAQSLGLLALWLLGPSNLALAYRLRKIHGALAWLGLAFLVAGQQGAAPPNLATEPTLKPPVQSCVQGGLLLVRVYRKESANRYRAKIEYALDAPSPLTSVRLEPRRSNVLLVFSKSADAQNSMAACSVGNLWLVEQGRAGVVPGPRRTVDPDLRSYYHSQGIETQIQVPHAVLARVWDEPPDWLPQAPADPWDRMALLFGGFQENLAHLMAKRIRDPMSRGLSQALLLGWKAGLDRGTKIAFQQSGTVHLLAVSGMHVLMIHGWVLLLLGGVYRLICRLGINRAPPPWVRLWGTSLPVLGYCLLTGGASSAWRAGLVLTWMEGARAMAGSHSGGLALFQAAACMLAFDPTCWQDPGFVLSFGAVSGLLWLYRPLATLWSPFLSKGLPRTIFLSSLLTICAQLVTTPITLYYFKQFPLYFLPANLVVVPLSGPLLALALAWTALGDLPFLGSIVQALGTLLFGLTHGVTGFISRLPGAVMHFPGFEAVDMAWFMGLVLVFIVLANRGRPWRPQGWLWWLLLPVLGWQVSCQVRHFKEKSQQTWTYQAPGEAGGLRSNPSTPFLAWIHRSPVIFHAGLGEPWRWEPLTNQPAHRTLLACGPVQLKLDERVELLVLHHGARASWIEALSPGVVVLSGFHPENQRIELLQQCMREGVRWVDLCVVRLPRP
ncbi:MAG: ComEC/Rec2 family competence protein [Bacteroidetes bacterium]|nr:ComEC/Rec2 family competence protein [Bacteroidota bacterium]